MLHSKKISVSSLDFLLSLDFYTLKETMGHVAADGNTLLSMLQLCDFRYGEVEGLKKMKH